jgi:hypothetical protein
VLDRAVVNGRSLPHAVDLLIETMLLRYEPAGIG